MNGGLDRESDQFNPYRIRARYLKTSFSCSLLVPHFSKKEDFLSLKKFSKFSVVFTGFSIGLRDILRDFHPPVPGYRGKKSVGSSSGKTRTFCGK